MNGQLRPKPGSILDGGAVVDERGQIRAMGPCFVPSDLGSTSRAAVRSEAYSRAGWMRVRAVADWPGIPFSRGSICVARGAALELIRRDQAARNARKLA